MDGDGSVNYSEFITAATNWKQTLNRQNLQTAFEMFDKDGNGTISLDELKQALGGDDFASNDIYVRMMEEADTNNDGEIDLDEFIAYMLRTSGIES